MKNITFIALMVLSNFIYAADVIKLSKEEKTLLNVEFSEIIAPLILRFGSGDIVGNGGGLIEQNFLFAYYSLQTAIDNCLTAVECYNTEEEKVLLKEINQIFIEKLVNKTPLIFIKNSDTNNFFFDKYDQTQRIAKTGFSKKFPIFINLDATDEIVNDIPTMIGIIVHELGHQIGIVNHSYLDKLGARVRKMWGANWVVSDVDVSSKKLFVRLYNTRMNSINSKLSYEFDGKIKSLNSLIFRNIACEKGDRLYGFSLSNGHWKRPTHTRFRTKVKKTFWIDINCEKSVSESYILKRDLDVEFTFTTFRDEEPILKSVVAKVE